MFKFFTFLCTVLIVFGTPGIAVSETIPTPTSAPENIQIISTDEANRFMVEEKTHHFDARGELNFLNGHLPGAVSLPLEWTRKGRPEDRDGKINLTLLPSDKNTKLIFHGSGPDGWKAYFAAVKAKEAGYRNVMWFRGGLSEWVKKGYAIEH